MEAPWQIRARAGSVPPGIHLGSSLPPRPKKKIAVKVAPVEIKTCHLRASRPPPLSNRSLILDRSRARSLEPPEYAYDTPIKHAVVRKFVSHKPRSPRLSSVPRVTRVPRVSVRSGSPASLLQRRAASEPKIQDEASNFCYTISSPKVKPLARRVHFTSMEAPRRASEGSATYVHLPQKYRGSSIRPKVIISFLPPSFYISSLD